MSQYPARRATAGQTFSAYGPDGREHTLTADERGVVRPRNDNEQWLADLFDLPTFGKQQPDEGKED